jgi:hypothetical protein
MLLLLQNMATTKDFCKLHGWLPFVTGYAFFLNPCEKKKIKKSKIFWDLPSKVSA